MIELIANGFILLGAIVCFVAAIGLVKFKDIYMKMHAATKASSLGCSLILIGVALQIRDLHAISEALMLIFFIAMTTPISAHLIAKAVYATRSVDK